MNAKELFEFSKYMNDVEKIDYKKRKNGLPDMRCAINKYCFTEFKKYMILKKNKNENPNFDCNTQITSSNYREEIEKLTEDEIEDIRSVQEESCVICGDVMEGSYCKLPCKHKFCVSCIIQHGRENDACPLCRVPMSGQDVKKTERICEHIINGITQDENTNSLRYITLNDPDNVYLKYDALYREMMDFRAIIESKCNGNITEKTLEEYTIEMFKIMGINNQVSQYMVASKVAKFYDDQL